MTSPRLQMICGLVAGLLLPVQATADHIVTFTGPLASSDYFSARFDGTDVFENDVPPLFDLGRLNGGSFRATYLVPAGPPTDAGSGFANFQYTPPVPFSVALLDPSGDVVHQFTAGLDSIDVENRREPGRPGRPGRRVNDVSFFGSPSGFDGLNAPPELYGPNSFFLPNIAAYFTDGQRPLGDVSIPLDGATYLDFADREFSIGLFVTNGDPDGNGPSLFVGTGLNYTVTGASVVPLATPEPTSLTLFAAGGLALLGYARRRAANSVLA